MVRVAFPRMNPDSLGGFSAHVMGGFSAWITDSNCPIIHNPAYFLRLTMTEVCATGGFDCFSISPPFTLSSFASG